MSLTAFFRTNEEKYVDFISGQELPLPADVSMMREICAIPYPGDTSADSCKWVLDTAAAALSLCKPQLLIIYIAMPLLLAMNTDLPRDRYLSQAETAIRSFIGKHDYTPYIIGMGGMTKTLGLADDDHIEGYIASSLWSYHYAGVFNAGANDEKRLRSNKRLAFVQSRDEFATEHSITSRKYLSRFPDFLLRAREGYSFRGIGAHDRLPQMIPRQDRYLPVICPGNAPEDIHGVKHHVADLLVHGEKIALILIEGVGEEDFTGSRRMIANFSGSYLYDHSINQYMALSTGRTVGTNCFPPVSDHRILKAQKRSPYQSIFFAELPTDRIGGLTNSLAVSSRCITGYASSGADITIECFCRNLQPLGNYAVFNNH